MFKVFSQSLIFISLIILLLSTAACGQKGDLYLPEPEEKTKTLKKPQQ